MPVALSLSELLAYSAEEREKWRAWLTGHPDAMDLPVQPGGRYPTVGKLIDHIFLVERRHIQRLRGETLATATGLTASNVSPLFDYGASVRRELEALVREMDENDVDQVRVFSVRDREWEMTPRKLLFHALLHEIRHWAQVALAVRIAGREPPGDHDLFFSRALR
jgi:uncharacterized damage-inducible protein DinB